MTKRKEIRLKRLNITKKAVLLGHDLSNVAEELETLDGLTATAAELNILDGATVTAAELNTLDLSEVGALVKVKKIPIATTPDGTEEDTGWDLPAKFILLDVLLDVTVAEATGATKTLDIGLLSSEDDGDADGFANGLDVSALGLVRPGVALVAGGNETYVGDWTRGLLLTAGAPLAGSNVAGDEGSYYEKPHLSTAAVARSVSFTAGGVDFAEFRGDIYMIYVEIG